MTISVKHSFQSAKGDGTDVTFVQPSAWNAEHTMTCATDKVIGRASAGTGVIEEIAATAFGRSILGAADLAALQAILGAGMFTTGDAKLTIKNAADTGWVMANDGTIGDATSGATTRANSDCSALYTLIWGVVSDTWAPVTGGRGASAAADFAAHKPMALTKVLGRALAISGTGSGLTARALGQALGEENHQLTAAELAAHSHTGTTDNGGVDHTHQHNGPGAAQQDAGPNGNGMASETVNNRTTSGASAYIHTHTFTTANAGSNASHNNMQPTSFLNLMIKL